MSERDHEALGDILKVLDRALGFPIPDLQILEETDYLQDALIRCLEVPWRAIAGMRDLEQSPGAAGMGGIDDHRPAGGNGLAEALEQQGTDLIPGPLHAGIPEEFSADHIGGEHQARLARFALPRGPISR